MPSREHGAAQVNVLFFIFALILMLGAVFFGYTQMTGKQESESRITDYIAKNRQLTLDVTVRDHYIEEIGKVVGTTGTWSGRDGFVYVDPDDPQAVGTAVNAIENVALPNDVRNAVEGFAKQVGIPASTATPINSLLSQAKVVLDNRDKRISDLEGQNTTLSTQVASANKAASDADNQRQTEVSKLGQDQNELRQRIDADLNKFNSESQSLRESVKQRREELDDARSEHAAQIAELNKQINLQKAQLDAQRRLVELINPPDEADGQVLDASLAASRAWINLGRKDMLPRGTVFDINAADGSGLKARGRVARLEYDRAELELFDIADEFNPVVKGDVVVNDLYSPNLRRNIFLMGRFSYPLTKPTVKMILEKLGNKVYDQVGPGIDLVLVGQDTLNEDGDGFTPVTESQEYKDALFLGIEIAPLSKVRDFLTLGDD